MTIQVRAPNGDVVNFPDGTPDATINQAMLQTYGGAQQSPQAQRPLQNNERDQLRNSAARRQFMREMVPFGLGYITEPLANVGINPEQREGVGRAFQGFVHDVQDLPRIDWGRAGHDTADNLTRAFQAAPSQIGNAVTHPLETLHDIFVAPFDNEERGQRDLDLARIRGDAGAARTAADDANRGAAGVAATAAAPLVPGGSLLRTVGGAALLTAPFAFSGEGSLQDRIPQGVTTMAQNAALAGGAHLAVRGVQGGAAALNRSRARTRRMADAFQRANVDPSVAAIDAGTFGGERLTGPLTNVIADNPIAGAAVRPRIERQLRQASEEARRIQGEYGEALSPEGAGAMVQRGVERYATDHNTPNPNPGADPRTVLTGDWSVPAQADAIYEHVLRPIENNPTTLSNTVQAISKIEALGDNDPTVLRFRRDPVLSDITNAVHEIYTRPDQPLSLRAARELRRRLRIQMDSPSLAGGQDAASLRRVYRALTDDIYAGAGALADDLRTADRFYARHMERIQDRLRAFDPNAREPSQSFQAIVRAAQERTGNVRALQALRASLRATEWRTLSASLIEQMGRPTAGAGGTLAADLGWSANTFSTNWRRMSPLARRTLFGSSSNTLMQDLDNLATVAGQLKGVERTTNASGSGRYANVAATAGGAIANLPATLTALAGAGLIGEALTNPAFVRLMIGAKRDRPSPVLPRRPSGPPNGGGGSRAPRSRRSILTSGIDPTDESRPEPQQASGTNASSEVAAPRRVLSGDVLEPSPLDDMLRRLNVDPARISFQDRRVMEYNLKLHGNGEGAERWLERYLMNDADRFGGGEIPTFPLPREQARPEPLRLQPPDAGDASNYGRHLAALRADGFDTERVYYHGMNDPLGGAQEHPVESLNLSERNEGVYLTPSPKVANIYTSSSYAGQDAYFGRREPMPGSVVLPVFTRGRYTTQARFERPVALGGFGRIPGGDRENMLAAIRRAQAAGFSGYDGQVRGGYPDALSGVPGLRRLNMGTFGLLPERFVFDAKDVRGRFAPQASPDESHARPVQASDGNASRPPPRTLPNGTLTAGVDPTTLRGATNERRSQAFHDPRLSPSENKAVEMARNGYTNPEIADELDTSINAVAVMLASARRKGVESPRSQIGSPRAGEPGRNFDRVPSSVLAAMETKMRQSGMSATDARRAIAERTGLRVDNVYQRIYMYRKLGQKAHAGPPSPEQLAGWMAALGYWSAVGTTAGFGLSQLGAQQRQ